MPVGVEGTGWAEVLFSRRQMVTQAMTEEKSDLLRRLPSFSSLQRSSNSITTSIYHRIPTKAPAPRAFPPKPRLRLGGCLQNSLTTACLPLLAP